MALLKCKDCGGKVSSAAKSCPGCGAKPPPSTSAFTWIVGGLFTVLVARCAFTGDTSPSASYSPTRTSAITAAAKPTAPAPPPDPKYLKELARIEQLTPEKFCLIELRKLRGKKGSPPQPWFDALAKAGVAHGIRGDHLINIQAGTAAIGMNRCGSMASWGRPEKVNTTTRSSGTREQWVYGNGNYLYFENETLTSIQN